MIRVSRFLGLAIGWAFPAAAFAQCEPRWSEQFQSPVLDGSVSCLIQYDSDGPGGEHSLLVAGGRFLSVNGKAEHLPPLNGIAGWNGIEWLPLGKGLLSDTNGDGYPDGEVLAFELFDEDGDGPTPPCLYAGGHLSPPGIQFATIVRWNGEVWENKSLGQLGGTVQWIRAVDEDGPGGAPPVLYAAGILTCRQSSAPYFPTCGVARFDGSTWERIPGIDTYAVRAIQTIDDDGPGPHHEMMYIAATDVWQSDPSLQVVRVNAGVPEFVAPEPLWAWNHQIFCLSMFDEDGPGRMEPRLFAGGNFVDSNNSPVVGVAKWDGQSWSLVGGGDQVHGVATAMRVIDEDGLGPIPPALFVTGISTGLPGATWGISRWDGRQWSSLGKGVEVLDGYYYDASGVLAVNKNDDDGRESIVVRGTTDEYIGQLVQWDGEDWSPLIGGGLASLYMGGSGLSYALSECFEIVESQSAIPGRKDLIVGGWFWAAGDVLASDIARWDGQSWAAIGKPVWAEVSALTTHDADGPGPIPMELYAGGYSYSFTLGFQIAVFRNNAWQVVASETGISSDYLGALTSFDPDGGGPRPPVLVAVGVFTEIDGQAVTNLAQWDGFTWSDLGGAIPGSLLRPAVFDEDGDGSEPARLFTSIQSVPGGGIVGLARWDGNEWKSVEPDSIRSVTALTVVDPDGDGPEPLCLFVGGSIRPAGETQSRRRVGKWNGQFWTYSPPFTYSNAKIETLAVMDDDGDGPEASKVFVSGRNLFYPDGLVNGAAVWDGGSSWQLLGGGIKALNHTASIVYDSDGPGGNLPSVIFGGDITIVGGMSSEGLARWGRLAPTILKQPASRTVTPFSPVAFSVRVGAGYVNTYQWRKNGRPLRNDARISGVQTDTLRISSVKDLDEGSYDLVVTNDCGTSESLQAQLTVRGARPVASHVNE